MKNYILLLPIFLLVLSSTSAQQTGLPSLDKSPMDISYFPASYPVLKIQDKISGPLIARVLYSRPKREGRSIFGGLVEYGKLWRLGANEATEIEFYKTVRINGKKIAKGRYTLYAIAYENSWTIIINKETDTWGHFKYDQKKDIVRIDVPAQKTTEIVESLSMMFDRSTKGANLIIAWDNIKVSMPITL